MLILRGGGYTAAIVPQAGANLIRLTHEKTGAQLLRSPVSVAALLRQPNVYGMPLLFPPNRIAGGQFQFQGQIYRFPINEEATGCHLHGSLSQTPFQIGLARQDRACLFYQADGTSSGFPHRFCVIRRYSLSENGLNAEITFHNESDAPMPLGVGIHCALRLPFLPGMDDRDCSVRVSLGAVWEKDRRHLPTGKRNWDVPYGDALRQGGMFPAGIPLSLLGENLGHGAILTDRRTGCEAVLLPDQKFRFWTLWNGDGQEGFFCPEPQSWVTNAPNLPLPHQETGFLVLAPGEKQSFACQLYLSPRPI